MREILEQVGKWFDAGEQVALASVVSTWGSSPRPAGSMMAISSAGSIAGSVSGGCVEGAVAAAALEILAGEPARVLHFGVADETAWEVGLACGGSIEVLVAPLPKGIFRLLDNGTQSEHTFTLATLIEGPGPELGRTIGWIDDPDAEPEEVNQEIRTLMLLANQHLPTNHPGRITAGEQDQAGREWFLNPILAAARLIIIGGVHISIALVDFAKPLGFETIIIDPRRLFASRERFPHVDRLIQNWPDEAMREVGQNSSTAVAVLTHDPKIDDPAVIAALASPAFYIGVLGSRKTHAKRLERLRAQGVPEQDLERLHAPIGIDIAAQTPEEIALSIMAQIVACRGRHGS